MRAILGVLGVLGISLQLSACAFDDDDLAHPDRRPDAAPLPPDASTPVDPDPPRPPEPPGPPFDDPNEVPFERGDVARYDFAYLGFRDGAEIRLGNLHGEWTVARPVEPGAPSTGSLAMSPTGHDLAYVSYDDVNGGFSLHVLSLDTFADRTVALDVRDALRPTWSPDGTRLLYFHWTGSDLELLMVETSGAAAPVTIGHTPTYGDEAFLRPDWSRDGSEIFYTTLDRIVVHDVAAGTERDVVVGEDGVAMGLPRLSPDGRTLAFAHGATIALVDRAGGTPRVLSEGRIAGRLVWRPDGTSLAVVDIAFGTEPQLRVIDLDGVAVQVDTRPGGEIEWSPDGSRLLYTVFAQRNGIGDNWLRVFHADAAVAVDLGLRGAGPDTTCPTWLRALPGKRD